MVLVTRSPPHSTPREQVKRLLEKTHSTGEDFQYALAHYRNVPRADGFSPAQLMFGRRQKGGLPIMEEQLKIDPNNFMKGREAREKTEKGAVLAHNKRARSLPELNVQDKVLIQNPNSGRWDCKGVINAIRESGRSFIVQDSYGKEFLRNRKMLRLDVAASDDPPLLNIVSQEVKAASAQSELRRSERLQKKTDQARRTWANPHPHLKPDQQPAPPPPPSTTTPRARSRREGCTLSNSMGPRHGARSSCSASSSPSPPPWDSAGGVAVDLSLIHI